MRARAATRALARACAWGRSTSLSSRRARKCAPASTTAPADPVPAPPAPLKIFRWTLIGILVLILIVFAVSNRQPIALSLWPLPIELNTRLYLVVLLTLLVGFLVGELVAWLNGRRWRREARRNARRVAELERELAALSPPKEAARELTRP